MYVTQKHHRDKKNSIIFLTLLLWFIFSISFFSFADNNNEFITHEVMSGDTLWSLSKEYNTPLKFILDINDVEDKDSLSIGQIIKIPQDNLQADNYGIHIVKKGESLWSIAQECNLSINQIIAANNLANSELISIGQQIEIPSIKNTTPETNVVTQPVIDKKNDNMNNNNSLPENTEPTIYTVKAGDSLWNISRKYGVSVAVIADINNLGDKDLLSLGQKIEIPAIGGGVPNSNQKQEPTIITYTVKGDNLWSISQKYDVNMSTIISTNSLKEISKLSIGQKLKLP